MTSHGKLLIGRGEAMEFDSKLCGTLHIAKLQRSYKQWIVFS